MLLKLNQAPSRLPPSPPFSEPVPRLQEQGLMEACSWAIDYSPVKGGKASPTQPNMIDCNSIKAGINLYLSPFDTFILFYPLYLIFPDTHTFPVCSNSTPVMVAYCFYTSFPQVSAQMSSAVLRGKISFCWLRLKLRSNCLKSTHKLWPGDTPRLSMKWCLNSLDYYSLFIDPSVLWATQGRFSLCLHCFCFA